MTLAFSVTLADCDVETFRAGGPGGQNQNKRDTGVRIRHRASGAVGEARDQRSQLQNKKSAFRRMAESQTFRTWVRKQTIKMGPTPEERVAEMMKQPILVEYRDGDDWVAAPQP
jgi:protein subunit release factor A